MIYKGYLWIVVVALSLILLFVFTCVRDAQAKTPFPYTTAHAIQIADDAWVEPCDGPITITRALLGKGILAQASSYDWDGSEWVMHDTCTDQDPNNNIITVTSAFTMDWPDYCTVIVHETGHLHGAEHSASGIMEASGGGIWRGCLPKRLWHKWRHKATTSLF